MARSMYSQIQRNLYLTQRLMGDGKALSRGTLPKRLVRRRLTRSLFRLLR
jgi:hypothetical protein